MYIDVYRYSLNPIANHTVLSNMVGDYDFEYVMLGFLYINTYRYLHVYSSYENDMTKSTSLHF